MQFSPSPLTRRIAILTVSITVALGTWLGYLFLFRGLILESPPTRARPWAEDHFQKLTAPVGSPGNPTDPQYRSRHSGSKPSTNSNYQVTVEFARPTTEYVPEFEVIEFDATDGFTGKSGSGTIRWLATKPYDPPPDSDYDPGASVLTPFRPDGSPMSREEAEALGITKRDLEARGLERNHVWGTAMKANLDLTGFANLESKVQDVFDAASHVSVRQYASIRPGNKGLDLSASLAILHDAPVLVVIDLAHGQTQDFTLPVEKGAAINHRDFRIEIIDVVPGTIVSGHYEPSGPGKTIDFSYGISSSPGPENTFSVIYQINPPSMGTAVTIDAIDATGNVIENRGKAMEGMAPAWRFAAPLASAASLQVKYRPQQTRLLLKIKALPGMPASNIKPSNLFDVRAPRITFRDSYQMRQVIASGSQLKDITGSWSYDTPAAFPMTLTNVSPSQVAERYLALDSGRKIKIDPGASMIKFEPPKKTTLIDRMIAWFKRQPWTP
jgi:hypothetical protein